MATLNDFPKIATSLKNGSTSQVKLLYRFIFGGDAGRQNRTQLRKFSGFPPDFHLEKAKQNALKEFSLKDLITICNLLHLEFHTDLEKCCDTVFAHLTDFSLLTSDVSESTDTDGLDESEPKSNVQLDPTGADETADCMPDHLELRNKTQTISHSPYRDSPTLQNKSENHFFWPLLKEICETTRSFSGKNAYSVHNFISDLEEMFCTYGFVDDIPKILITKKLLRDPARIFVLSLKNITCFDYLKAHLITEFGTKISSIDVHKLLSSRKLKQNESVTEYFIAMRALASQGNIDDESLIEYCIDGLPDSQAKLILYGCSEIFEFKQKLRSFEKLYLADVTSKNNFHDSFKPNNNSNRNFSRDNRKNFTEERDNRKNFIESKFHAPVGNNAFRESKVTRKFCYNCGERNHISSQ